MGQTEKIMSDKDLNLAIYHELERMARDYFREIEYILSPGSYTAKQMCDVMDIDALCNEVCVKVETFSVVMPEKLLFNALCQFEKLLKVRQKDKVKFIRMDKRSMKAEGYKDACRYHLDKMVEGGYQVKTKLMIRH